MEQRRTDEHIAQLVARAPRMTPEQAARLRQLFKYGPPDETETAAEREQREYQARLAELRGHLQSAHDLAVTLAQYPLAAVLDNCSTCTRGWTGATNEP
jgi:hypothetical protein